MKRFFFFLLISFAFCILFAQSTKVDTAVLTNTNAPGKLNPGGVIVNSGTVNKLPALSFRHEVMAVPAVAFRSGNQALHASYDTHGGLILSEAAKSVEFWAPLILPQGATLTSVELVAQDNFASDDVDCSLLAMPHNTPEASVLPIAEGKTAGAGFGLKNWPLKITSPTIQNDKYSYQITLYANNWPSSSNFSIKTVIIKFDYPIGS